MFAFIHRSDLGGIRRYDGHQRKETSSWRDGQRTGDRVTRQGNEERDSQAPVTEYRKRLQTEIVKKTKQRNMKDRKLHRGEGRGGSGG